MSFDPNEKRPKHCWVLRTNGIHIMYACAHCKFNPRQRMWPFTPDEHVKVVQSLEQHSTHCWFVRHKVAI
jgi:hypothetical protein